MATPAIKMGGPVRVGLENNSFLRRVVLARSNTELVETVLKLSEEAKWPIATPDEVRQTIRLKGKHKVRRQKQGGLR